MQNGTYRTYGLSILLRNWKNEKLRFRHKAGMTGNDEPAGPKFSFYFGPFLLTAKTTTLGSGPLKGL